jgi:hypothetical protein
MARRVNQEVIRTDQPAWAGLTGSMRAIWTSSVGYRYDGVSIN